MSSTDHNRQLVAPSDRWCVFDAVLADFKLVYMALDDLIVGMSTSGTFMPILIALAFLQTELIPGVASLLLVVAIGLLIRSLLSALNLLLVARIATLVVVVIGIISFVSVLSYELGLIGGLTITFFPMIILAWTIERMSILWEEEGPKEVLVQGGGSLIVAILAYLLMDLETVRYWAFNFPELHLCLLAVIMLLGRYTGYRLLELQRFATFAQLKVQPASQPAAQPTPQSKQDQQSS